MDIKRILSACDHTLLDRGALEADIKRIIDEGVEYATASVCIPPCHVKYAKAYANGRVKICTVIGFPNGYSKTAVKVYEAREAVADGADEIDMVINHGMVRSADFAGILEEINQVKAAVGEKILKVIIETCLLTEEEKRALCQVVSDSGADFIKTSTGFSTGGATLKDVVLLKKYMKNGKGIKAAGGISSLEDAVAFLDAGATRLGTSRIVNLVKNKPAGGY